MKNSLHIKKLMSAISATILLLYFMGKSPSPKIVFIPFLICSISMGAKSIAGIMNKKKMEYLFGKLFVFGFLLFLVGFLIAAAYVSIRDKNYSMLIFSVPFWLVGIYLVKNKLLNKRVERNEDSFITFAFLVSSLLVVIAFIAGIVFFVFGFRESNMGLIFGGIIFTFGSLTFVLAGLTIKGCFDKVKIDVLGLYAGAVIAVIGIGFLVLICKGAEISLGLWIIIPVLMTVVGVYQVIKCIRNKK